MTPCTIPTSSGIYRIVCEANGKVYVGLAVNLRARWALHRSALAAGKHHNAHLQAAWNKYGGLGAFHFEVVELVPRERLLEVEQRHIDECPEKFNICKKAGSTFGVKPSAESIAKSRKANTGRKRSAETKARMSAASRGHATSDETRAKMKASSARRWAKAKAEGFSEETRAKQQASQRRKVFTPETRAKLSAAAKLRFARQDGKDHQRAINELRWSRARAAAGVSA